MRVSCLRFGAAAAAVDDDDDKEGPPAWRGAPPRGAGTGGLARGGSGAGIGARGGTGAGNGRPEATGAGAIFTRPGAGGCGGGGGCMGAGSPTAEGRRRLVVARPGETGWSRLETGSLRHRCAHGITVETPSLTCITMTRQLLALAFLATQTTALQELFGRASAPKVSAPLGFTTPKPQPLTITRKESIPDLLRGTLALAVRLATGTFVLGWTPVHLSAFGATLGRELEDGEYRLRVGPFEYRDESSVLPEGAAPREPFIVYEYESSPFCRKVRECCCLLDVPVEYRPVPGARAGAFAAELAERGGKMVVPYAVDGNTGFAAYESDDIIEYLLSTYGPPRDAYDPLALWPLRGSFAVVTSTLAALARGLPCSTRRPDARNDNERMRPLELWGYETSPFVKPVREALCELTLPHVVVPCARGSRNRDRLVAATGRFQVPFLRDPNTGVELFESPEIVDYLNAVYTTGRRE